MRVTDEMVFAAWNALDVALAGRLDGTEYAYGDFTPMKHALEQVFALSHAARQEVVGYVTQGGGVVWLKDGSFSMQPKPGTNLYAEPAVARSEGEV